MNKGYKFSKIEYEALNYVAKITGMNSWFSIQEKGDYDVIYDLEEKKIISVKKALQLIKEGLPAPLSDCCRTIAEERALSLLFQKFSSDVKGKIV